MVVSRAASLFAPSIFVDDWQPASTHTPTAAQTSLRMETPVLQYTPDPLRMLGEQAQWAVGVDYLTCLASTTKETPMAFASRSIDASDMPRFPLSHWLICGLGIPESFAASVCVMRVIVGRRASLSWSCVLFKSRPHPAKGEAGSRAAHGRRRGGERQLASASSAACFQSLYALPISASHADRTSAGSSDHVITRSESSSP